VQTGFAWFGTKLDRVTLVVAGQGPPALKRPCPQELQAGLDAAVHVAS
jgi:hypothetical protein